VPFRFSGKLNKVTIRPQPRTLTPDEEKHPARGPAQQSGERIVGRPKASTGTG
jgi:hypothetical protein